MIFFPSRAAWLHLRIVFSLFLVPVYVFALSQVPFIHTSKAALVFLIWHFFIYPASNGYNSFFDKDEGSIALLKSPPKVDKSLYFLSLFLDIMGIALALLVSIEFAISVFVYGFFSKLYSHPSIRLKKYPVISFLVVFVFQGAFVYFSTYSAISGIGFLASFNANLVLAGLFCSCLIGASYPLTQVYQHDQDRKRGDITLSILLGIRGSFYFSAMLFGAAILLLFLYWNGLDKPTNFWMFLGFVSPLMAYFLYWFGLVYKDESQANFLNMTRITFLSGIMMLVYFLMIFWLG